MKKDELHDICKKYHIKAGKKKQQYVDNIEERSKTVPEKGNQLETLKNSFSTDNLADSCMNSTRTASTWLIWLTDIGIK